MVDKMSKFKIIFVMAFLVSFSVQAVYVRKLKEPDFFIPEGEQMHLQEKLPPLKDVHGKIVSVNEKEDIYTEVPEYKKKYDNYLEDVAVFIKTKEMPENKVREEDLKAMESGEVFEVTQEASQEARTKEQKEFNTLLQKIVKD